MNSSTTLLGPLRVAYWRGPRKRRRGGVRLALKKMARTRIRLSQFEFAHLSGDDPDKCAVWKAYLEVWS